MPKSLQTILGTTSRVRKPSSQAQSRQTTSSPSPRKARRRGGGNGPYDDSSLSSVQFEDKLDDEGAARLLGYEEALTLRDVVQAMRYVRRRMFTAVPDRGLDSRRAGELRTYQASMPPVVTAGHLHAILDSPTQVERETAELLSRGVVRRVRVATRGAMGEGLIESADLLAMVGRSVESGFLSRAAGDAFAAFLRDEPTAQTVQTAAADILSDTQADELIRAGFLTSSLPGSSSSSSFLRMRPEDRTTLTSIQRISRHPSGSLSAVGGRDAIHLAGGGSGHGSSQTGEGASLRVAIPGHGRHLKLSQAGVDWVREALGRTRFGECPESWLRERFDGGASLYGARWRDFSGVRWEWVLGEAVGLGVVELFETKSVGRGVRALS
ncbi:Serine-threonine protein kinase 19 [Geosmithia morbida]|uniref:Serine-threonine protein kinase 19 n=1 Tax=Geosmithia morbida TaxID=1094350 RepID=A0A9P4YWL6_9HYPO|nr:Serine-threonine protein kinase 19 [Geosmithia morbida]KAF4123385.1 Serine-threonine protein kinase 19 [Geosmithia morbida]